MKVLRIGTMLNDVEVVDIKEQPLKTLQTMVDGYIEVCTPVYWRDTYTEFLCNEEGRIKEMGINENFFPWYDLRGAVVVVGVNVDDESEFDSLTDNQIMCIKRWLKRLQFN